MRGEFVIPIEVPRRGLVSNLPSHRLPQDSLAAGSNVFVDIDGSLRPRRGYAPITGFTGDGTAINGMLDVLNPSAADHYLIVATASHVYLMTIKVDSTLTPTASGQTTLLTGSFSSFFSPATFAVIWEQEKPIVYMAGSNQFAIQRIDLTAATAVAASNTPSSPFDMTMLGNRIVVVCPSGDTTTPSRVQWSSRFNGQVWPAFGYNDLDLDPDDTIRAIRPIDRSSAVIYRQRSIWLMQPNSPTNDFNPFSFIRLPLQDKISGPVRTNAIVSSGTTQYYLGTDQRIYSLNGTQVQHISGPIDEAIETSINWAYAERTQATYMPTERLIWFFIPTGSAQQPNAAIVYNELDQRWEPLAAFTADTITAAYTSADLVHNASFATAVGTPLVYVGTNAGGLMNFWNESQLTDNGSAISWSATWPTFSTPDPLGMVMVDGVELYFTPTASSQTLTATLQGVASPASTSTITNLIAASGVDVSVETTWLLNTVVGPNNTANIKSNFLQFILSGTAAAGPVQFIGARIFCNQDKRPDFRAI